MPVSPLEEHLNRQAERSRQFFWNRLRWELVSGQLDSGSAHELVDVGAGPGFLGDFLAERHPAFTYRFIEPIEGLQRQLEDRFGADANLIDADSFGEARFVTLLDVLEHQADDRAFLADLAAKMAPGSTLLLTVPAMSALWSQWDVALGHYRRYTKGTLRSCAAGLPFEAEEVSYLFPELLPAGLVRRLRRPARGDVAPGEDQPGADATAEFPDLPGPVNAAFYRCGRATMRLRALSPFGTSLFARLRRV